MLYIFRSIIRTYQGLVISVIMHDSVVVYHCHYTLGVNYLITMISFAIILLKLFYFKYII